MSAILTAFGALQAAYSDLHLLPVGASDADCEPHHQRREHALETLRTTTATTPAEHAAKLRAALQGIDQDGDDALLILDLRELLDSELRGANELTGGDFFTDMVWTTIVDLERQARAAEADPHLALLAERNTLIDYLDSDAPTDDEADEGAGRLNAMDRRIIETPATTKDGVFAKLLLSVQLLTEGAIISDEHAARTIREALMIAGVGRVSPNVMPAAEVAP